MMKALTRLSWIAVVALGAIALGSPAWAQSLTLNVTGPNGEAIGGYRWLLEEDATYHSVPGHHVDEAVEPPTLALTFHTSYMPIASKGHADGPAAVPVDPTKHYFISILPDAGYTNGGGAVAPGQTELTVTVNPLPLPTAQISIFVYEDLHPINNAPDLPEELGIANFRILLTEAGGRYGASGGQVMQDAYGNPLGTTYNPDGSVKVMGNGIIKTDAEGYALIQNLWPGKYGVEIIPPAGEGWIQTHTIEGTKTIDAWVKAKEPAYFTEFGPPGWHVFVGFVRPMQLPHIAEPFGTIEGQIVNLHLSRPPATAFHNGAPFGHTTPWVGLNNLAVGLGDGVYAQRAREDGTFTIHNVPPGLYSLVVWDENLDLIISQNNVEVPPEGGLIDLGQIGVFQWYARLEHQVFYDENENGFRDPGEIGIPEQNVNLRWRDGSVYQSFPTDGEGFVPFDEVFPFFHWLVAEVDFARFKATGVTVTVDDGGAIPAPGDPNYDWTFEGQLNPQPQPDNLGLPYRTEQGPVLTQAFQGFIGQTSVLQWGKAPYGEGENGGIAGIVYYAVTRAENDPRYAVGEPWEPGIPRVVVNLYQDSDWDGEIDDLDGDGISTLADVDNWPFGNFPGAEDIDRDYPGHEAGVFDYGDAIQITLTDSWDDNLPSGCPGDPADPFYRDGAGYDGMRVWNQVRPGVFDGGYAFASYFDGGMANTDVETDGLPIGIYIVEAVPPKGAFGDATYELVKEEDKNVDFGDEYEPPVFEVLPPYCVGDPHEVPAELDLFPGIPAPYAGDMRPLCDRKQVTLYDGKNAAADFFFFTEVPVAAHVVGFVLNDLANEFDPRSPQFGEKFAPPWLPVTFRDWTGRVISRVYSDEWGKYNAIIPSTYTVNIPCPSGVAPNMLIVCLNDPGPIPDGNGGYMIDPYYNRQYSQFCYTFQFMPGTTTYLDTPVLPLAAFAGPDQFALDCEFPDGTPKIYSVMGPQGGPYVAAAGDTITIVAEGPTDVPNPAFEGPNTGTARLITRDFGFGNDPGIVSIGGVLLENVAWSDGVISATVPVGATTGILEVTRADTGLTTPIGVTVTVGPVAYGVHQVPGDFPTIQDAIDAAAPGDLILVAPGGYDEMVIMWKPVKLQGWGAGSTVISASAAPGEKVQTWRNKVQSLWTNGDFDLLPAQEAGFGGIEPAVLFTEEGAGILVLAKDASPNQGGFGLVDGLPNARIDGLAITGSAHGGGIVLNGYARYLEISNNRIFGNQGFYGGGIRSGHPTLVWEHPLLGLVNADCDNPFLNIHHNHITQNGGLGGVGGGVSLCTGSEEYLLSENFICGNFTQGDGGGVGQIGHCNNSVIADNKIIFNQSFNQGQAQSGGGIFIGGALPAGPGLVTEGTGNVTVVSNLIQGNQAGSGDGGGIRTAMVSGQDVLDHPNGFNGRWRPGQVRYPEFWHRIDILDNVIVNNMAGLRGGAISMQDTPYVNIYHNTIANNDSTATTAEAFTPGVPGASNRQDGSAIVSYAHSPELVALFGDSGGILEPKRYIDFSNPWLENNIILHNRRFNFVADTTQNPPFYGLQPDVTVENPDFTNELWVYGVADGMSLEPKFCLLTDATGYDASNVTGDPAFVAEYFNGDRGQTVQIPEQTSTIQTGPAFDEGGNFIDVRFGPLTLYIPTGANAGSLYGDYHLTAGSVALGLGGTLDFTRFPNLTTDIDGDPRPATAPDSGADEVAAGVR